MRLAAQSMRQNDLSSQSMLLLVPLVTLQVHVGSKVNKLGRNDQSRLWANRPARFTQSL